MDGFHTFEERRGKLLDMIDRLRPVLDGIDVQETTGKLDVVHDRVKSDTFKVMVVGEFNRGKSTVINALLGERVLPSYAQPCTAVINEVKWGEERRVRLHPMPVNGQDVAPVDIGIDELADHVTIEEGEDGRPRPNPYARAEVFWPLPLCRNRVEIIDSPGLNEAAERELITHGYLDQADALVMVLMAISPVSLSEQTFLNAYVRGRGHHDAFFLFTRIDDVPEAERASTMKTVRGRLSRYSTRENRIYFVNARGMLEGRIAQDHGRMEASGMLPFEAELERFLTSERGRLKVLVPALRLKNVLTDARRGIETLRGMLQKSAADLRRDYEAQQGPLRQVEHRHRLIMSRVDTHLRDIADEVGVRARAFYRETANDMEQWVLEIPLESKLKGFNPATKKAQGAAVQAELSEKLSAKLQNASADWQETELREFVEARVEGLRDEIGEDLTELVDRIDAIRYELAAVPRPDSVDEGASGIERVLAAGLGTVLGGPGLGFAGANFGFKGVAKAVVPTLGVVVLGAALGFTAFPVFLAVVAVNLVGVAIQGDTAEKNLKAKIAREYANRLRDQTDTIVTDLVAEVRNQLGKVREVIDQGIEAEVRGLRQEAENALARREADEADTSEVLRELARHSSTLNDLDEDLAEFIKEVAVPVTGEGPDLT
ncbi:dynamin family protein [Streptomyces sp. NPDC018964]|uniref:dynamin family protein n=1 Tax=Streptomyces sp. NPDC018964 TaxID=3365058 RepID=UPI0037ADA215